jgi:putative SOS response-associated peptidase YedK
MVPHGGPVPDPLVEAGTVAGVCGRFTSTSTIEDLASCFGADEVRTEALPPRWNVAPTDPVVAVATRPGPDRMRVLGRFRWGLVPSWASDPSVGSRMINARAETVATRPAFRAALERRRCLIPADAFYEWAVLDGRSKQPWAVRLASGEPMAFGGLWEVWRDAADPGANLLRTCAVVTTSANEALAHIHHRMPVVLDRSAWDPWLDPGNDDLDALRALLVPAPAERFEAHPVSTLVNSVRRDGPELLEPLPAGPDRQPLPGGQAQLLE